jgi:hypothetical protein
LYRDINRSRITQKLPQFPAVWYVLTPVILVVIGFLIAAGAIFSIIGAIGAGVNDQNEAAVGLAGAGVVTGLFAVLILLVSGVLQYVFLGLAISKLNQYWDKRTGGKAVGAAWGKGEIAIIVIGVVLTILNYGNSGSSNAKYKSNGSQPVSAVTRVLT